METIPASDPMQNPTHAPLAGLDPADLLRQGAAGDTLMEGAASSFNPPPIEELAAIFPQFEILELIGKGGMGAVYKVRQKDLDRIVALKILPPAIGQSPEFSARFTREAKALAKLNHPGIVTIHEFGQSSQLSSIDSQPLYFILMEFVDGVNLAQLMKTGRISPREALAIVPQICDALQYAHDQGIVHRDIKPENLLLDRSGRVKVADFGIAKVVAAVCDRPAEEEGNQRRSQTDATLAGKIIGTPQYMAPEQIDHPADVDHRADIYALGVVFYQMLTGELPGRDLQAPSRKVHIDVRLDEIVLKAMEKDPELRYQQASILRTRVETIPIVETSSDRVRENVLENASVPLREKAFRWGIHLVWAACTSGLVALAITFVSEILTKSRGDLDRSLMTWEDVYGPVITVLLGCCLLAIPIKAFRFASARVWIGAVFATAGITAITYVLASPVDDPAFHAYNFIVAVAICALGTFLCGFAAVFGVERFSVPKKPSSDKNLTGRAIAIGLSVLVLFVAVVVGLGVPLVMHNRSKQADDRSLAAHKQEVARGEQTVAQLEMKLSEYDWADLAAEGHLGAGVPEKLDGRTVLKIENLENAPKQVRLLTIEKPLIGAMRYAVSGEVRYENVQGQAYLEMWSDFPEGRYFSRTLGDPGSDPMSQLTGTSVWRKFILPFDRAGTKNAPTRIEVNLFLPGRGVVFVGPLRLIEVPPDEASLDEKSYLKTQKVLPDVMNEQSSEVEKISFRELPVANRLQIRMVAPDDPLAVPAVQRLDDGTKSLLKLSNNVVIWDKHVKDAGIQKSSDEYEITISLNDVGTERLAAATKNADGKMRLAVIVDGEVMSAPVVMNQLGREFVFAGWRDQEKCLGLVKDLVEWPDEKSWSGMSAWLEMIDLGKSGEAWDMASGYLRQNISREPFERMAAAARKPLGDRVTRTLLSAKRLDSLPGTPDGQYLVSEFDSSFKNKKDAKEMVTLLKEKDGRWRICGYFIQ